jgi:hypothetical protein
LQHNLSLVNFNDAIRRDEKGPLMMNEMVTASDVLSSFEVVVIFRHDMTWHGASNRRGINDDVVNVTVEL